VVYVERMRVLSMAWLAAAVCAARGEEIPRGQVVERVICRADEQQSYALYLPQAYTVEKMWPIVYCLDPGARGKLPVERLAKAAESEGFIVVGSNNSRNGPIGPIRDALSAMLMDVHARFSVDDSRAYAAGFSGGARVVVQWARNKGLAGVLACGAGYVDATPRETGYKIFLAAGIDDFNYPELRGNSLEMARNGVAHRFATFEGGHEWLTEALALEALQYFVGKVGTQAAVASKEEDKLDARYRELIGRVAEQNDALVKRLRRESEKTEDSGERRVARRVLNGAFVGAMEEARQRMEDKQPAAAARAYEVAVLVRPGASGAWRGLAQACEASGNWKRAAEAEEKAKALGFAPR
jgi:poly(3-hydroxybutyrate) depolymerase